MYSWYESMGEIPKLKEKKPVAKNFETDENYVDPWLKQLLSRAEMEGEPASVNYPNVDPGTDNRINSKNFVAIFMEKIEANSPVDSNYHGETSPFVKKLIKSSQKKNTGYSKAKSKCKLQTECLSPDEKIKNICATAKSQNKKQCLKKNSEPRTLVINNRLLTKTSFNNQAVQHGVQNRTKTLESDSQLDTESLFQNKKVTGVTKRVKTPEKLCQHGSNNSFFHMFKHSYESISMAPSNSDVIVFGKSHRHAVAKDEKMLNSNQLKQQTNAERINSNHQPCDHLRAKNSDSENEIKKANKFPVKDYQIRNLPGAKIKSERHDAKRFTKTEYPNIYDVRIKCRTHDADSNIKQNDSNQKKYVSDRKKPDSIRSNGSNRKKHGSNQKRNSKVKYNDADRQEKYPIRKENESRTNDYHLRQKKHGKTHDTSSEKSASHSKEHHSKSSGERRTKEHEKNGSGAKRHDAKTSRAKKYDAKTSHPKKHDAYKPHYKKHGKESSAEKHDANKSHPKKHDADKSHPKKHDANTSHSKKNDAKYITEKIKRVKQDRPTKKADPAAKQDTIRTSRKEKK